MPDFTLRMLTFIKVSSSDCLLTRQRLCIGDNAGHSPVGPLRQLKIIRPGEERKAAWGSESETQYRPLPGGWGKRDEALTLDSSLFCSVDLNSTTYISFRVRDRSRKTIYYWVAESREAPKAPDLIRFGCICNRPWLQALLSLAPVG